MLFVVTILLLVWIIGIWAVWLKAHINLPLDGDQHAAGEVPTG